MRRNRWLWNGVALAVIVVVAFPVYWMVVTSFRDNSDIRSAPASCRSARSRTTGPCSSVELPGRPVETACG